MNHKLILGLTISLVSAYALGTTESKHVFITSEGTELLVRNRSAELPETPAGLIDVTDIERSSFAKLTDHDKAVFSYAAEATDKLLMGKSLEDVIKSLMVFSSIVKSYADKPAQVFAIVVYAFYDSLVEAKGDLKATNDLFHDKIAGIEKSANVYLTH